jgi:predicted DNA-binding WGR domain protein
MLMAVYLERREPEENIHRFYEIEVGRDLFGIWYVTRRWGWIGTSGRRLVSSFDLELDAEDESQRLRASKSKRGYFAMKPSTELVSA